MTVRAPAAPFTSSLSSADAVAPPELRTVWGVVLGGSLQGDVIIASPEALTIVRTGRFVRAFVLAGIESLRRTVIAGSRTIRLEQGFYRAAAS